MIKRIHVGGPFGDEMHDYRFETPKGYTVGEFIADSLKQHPEEWGSFYWRNVSIASYRSGKIDIDNQDLFDFVKNKKIVSMVGHGGWTLMNYYIEWEGEHEYFRRLRIERYTNA